MKSKLLFLIFGVILILISGYLSTIHYNAAPTFGTVHEFSYGCIIQSPEFMGTYDSAHERGTCIENYVLSLILISFVVGGIILVIKSNTRPYA